MDGTVRVFDVSDPRKPVVAHEPESRALVEGFTLPAARSYELPPIAHVADFPLLDETGASIAGTAGPLSENAPL